LELWNGTYGFARGAQAGIRPCVAEQD